MTATYQIARDLGWDYFEKLAKQRVMQVQSASDPPKKLALGERAIMADGIEYGMFQLKETGKPVDVIYPAEGSPLIIGPNGILKNAPNPNAARLLQNFMLSAECQQFNVDFGGLRSAHALVKDKAGRKPMKDIKMMKDDAAAVEKESEEIKARYTQFSRCDEADRIGAKQRRCPAARHVLRRRRRSARPCDFCGVPSARAAVATQGAAAAPPATGDHAGADRGGQEGRQGRLLHVGRPADRREDRQGLRGEIPGIAVRVERTGAERVFQRIGQEYASRIYAVDVVNSSDAAHFIVWKRDGMLAPLRAGGRRQALSGRAQGSRRHCSRASAWA